ncbi:MAG: MOSC N-terminal beta barrel domain-containing protein, partial [Pseudomonadota bacterium]
MITLAHIYRHPIKAHGSERLDRVALSANATLPWDRVWAVTHEGTQDDGTADWARCRNFSRGASSPQLMAITSQLDVSTGMLALSHPDRPDITIHPDTDGDAFIDWVSPLMPAEGRASTRLIRADSA